ncbi:transcriptional regulator, MarR family [Verrucomicrobium sp. GAS474]|uniref:MarR family winged helix-turn-helix transcriptional regulator n=1 Tax=Verrucomicrobium sp. GAS474 TaxID=1882831 RepID=UPI00087C8327|nr:MarR family transcriptional regulator [Verrucomicrobium sp. GAS474]SDU07125.1 transcriptional regulator, MarR family [Verrucomicrobium sp. GAS474]
MTEIEQTAIRLRMALRPILRKARALSHPDGPNESQKDILLRLDEREKMTPSDLAAATQLRPQTIGQTLDSLDRRKWIVRSPHPTDRRRILISLSAAGRRVIEKGRDRRQAWLASEMAKLSPADFKALRAALPAFEQIAAASRIRTP